MAMEEGKISSSSSSQSNSTGGNARWTPTKDQIAVLENLYKQGVRTPTAEQIQQITGKLREFGSIEGKNVFYWFQNHKARQRQKQKQQTFAYYSKLIKRAHPGAQVLAPAAPMQYQLPNAPAVSPQPVACNGVVIFRPTMYPAPQPEGLNYYQQVQTQAQTQAQYSALFIPEPTKMSPSPVFQSQNLPPKHALQTTNNCYHSNYASVSDAETGATGKETLQLFPLHPANRRCERSGGSVTSDLAELSERVDEEGEEEVGCEHQYLFDFLGALNG